jgi:DNA helicase-2/ATP-dependent DNA helicase PcrA
VVNEIRIFGPPGTGKTTTLQREITAAAQEHGSDAIIVASFTKTAAAELVGRNLPLDRSHVGTLHSHCYRAIGKPPLADAHLGEWNAEHKAWKMTADDSTANMLDEPASERSFQTQTDEIYSQYQILRSQMISIPQWPLRIQRFAELWKAWKKSHGYIDFTDMIEIAYHDTRLPLPGVTIGYFDEAQDFTRLELALIRKWGESMDRVVISGDDDQCIYSFCGATPDAFINPPVSEKNKIVLAQSYRVPRVVQAYAQRWIERCKHREMKEYRSRDEEGTIRSLPFDCRNPEQILDDAERYLSQGKTVMFLTSCSFMLGSIEAVLRQRGIPFHNPYRRTRGDWNPLTSSGTSSAQRLLSFLAMDNEVWGEESHMWTGKDMQNWAEILKADKIFARGAKVTIEKLDLVAEINLNWLITKMTPDAYERAFDMDIDWFYNHALSSKQHALTFPYTVAKLHGAKLLREIPKVIIGTIHSVKGGQADVVYLFPDLSKAGMKEWLTAGDAHEATIRQFYVGMTRCRETLVLCSPSSQYAVQLPHPKEVLSHVA